MSLLYSPTTLPKRHDIRPISQCPHAVSAVTAPIVAYDAAREVDVEIDQNRTQFLYQETCNDDACAKAGAVCEQVRGREGNGRANSNWYFPLLKLSSISLREMHFIRNWMSDN